jgi:hypothetical protein
MSRPPSSPAGRAPSRARPRRILHLLALTVVPLPLVALAPADLDVRPVGHATQAVHAVAHADADAVAWELVVLDGDAMLQGPTAAGTVDEALLGFGVARGPLDRVEPVHQFVGDETPVVRVVRIVRVGLDAERRESTTPYRTFTVEDPDLLRGYVQVVRPGRPGLVAETGLVLHADGEVEAWLSVERVVVREPIDRIERVGTREFVDGTVWDALARCESSGRWDVVRHVDDRISYHGGLQFDARTWTAFRPAGFPEVASQATREQQIAVAERVLKAQGWGAWPACADRLGLR